VVDQENAIPAAELEPLQKIGAAISEDTKGRQLPDVPSAETQESTKAAVGGSEDEFAALTRRFEALKTKK
jgi:hypothetical protein